MLTWSSGGSQTQVGSSWKKQQGLLSSASLGREWEEPEATYCRCCYVHFLKKRGYGRDKKTRQQTASRQLWGRPSVKIFPPRVALETFASGWAGIRIWPSPLNISGTGWKRLIWACKNISGTEGRRLKSRVKINTRGREGDSEVKGSIRYEALSSLSPPHPHSVLSGVRELIFATANRASLFTLPAFVLNGRRWQFCSFMHTHINKICKIGLSKPVRSVESDMRVSTISQTSVFGYV